MFDISFGRTAPVVVVATAWLAGCGSLSGVGGSSEYSCKAQPGVHCESVSGTYQNALNNNLPSQRQAPAAPPSRSTESEPTSRAGAGTQPAALMSPRVADPSSDLDGAIGARPLRAPARILRLWFKPWEDADHDLFDQGYIYVQVDGGRWMLDHAHRKIRDSFAPVRPPRVVQAPAALDQPSSADGPPSLGAVPRSPDGLRTGAVEQVTAPPTRVGTRSGETEQQP